MYTLTFKNAHNERTVRKFDDSSDAVNEAVYLQVMDGGYNTSTEWHYEVTDTKGNVVYSDECMRYFA